MRQAENKLDLAMTLTFDFWPRKPFQHCHSRGEYLWQVSWKSLH